MSQVLKFVQLVSIIASQVVNSVFDKLRYYSWIFVNIGRKARFCVSRITIWNIHTQRLEIHTKLKIFINKKSKSNNTPAAPVCGVYVSQLIRYSRACGSYQDFRDRGLLLTRKLLNQEFLLVKLRSSLPMFYGHHHDLVDRYGISVS